MKNYIAVLKDSKGTRWVFEKVIDGHPLFVKEDEAKPLLMTKEKAYSIAMKYMTEGDVPSVEKSLLKG